MMVNGLMVNMKDMGLRFMKRPNMRDNGNMASEKVRGNRSGKMVVGIRESGLQIKFMEMVFIIGQIIRIIMVPGKKD